MRRGRRTAPRGGSGARSAAVRRRANVLIRSTRGWRLRSCLGPVAAFGASSGTPLARALRTSRRLVRSSQIRLGTLRAHLGLAPRRPCRDAVGGCRATSSRRARAHSASNPGKNGPADASSAHLRSQPCRFSASSQRDRAGEPDAARRRRSREPQEDRRGDCPRSARTLTPAGRTLFACRIARLRSTVPVGLGKYVVDARLPTATLPHASGDTPAARRHGGSHRMAARSEAT